MIGYIQKIYKIVTFSMELKVIIEIRQRKNSYDEVSDESTPSNDISSQQEYVLCQPDSKTTSMIW